MKIEEIVYNRLEQLDLPFVKHQHPAVYTVEEAKKYYHLIPGGHCKNLFLRDKKGRKHFLVIVSHDKQVNLKQLSVRLGADNLSFASPKRLMDHLGLEPGSVSPFGIINDTENRVVVIVDEELLEAEDLNFHPNINTLTVTVASKDFTKFLDEAGNEVRYIKI